jgi:hypothetical protein
MPSTYTLNNGIELIGTGEQSGTWGDTTNTNLGLLDVALDGQVTVALASAGSSGSPNSLPISDGTASNGRNRMVVFSDSGDLGATAYVQLTPNDAEKIIYIRNSLSGSRSVILFQGTYNASNDYEVPAGTTAVVYFDGAGAGAVAANVFNNAHFDAINVVGTVTATTVTATTVNATTVDAVTVEFDNLSGTGAVSVTNILDEDNMASDSATALATQQSIKAYVDAQVATVDTLAEILAIGNTTGATDIAVDSAQKVQFRDAAIYINSSVDGQLDIVADTEIQIAATTVDVNGALDVSGTALVTGVLTTTAATVFNGGFAAGGVGTFADGSNSAPSLTNTGDLNTGLYFPAADEVGLTVGGTQRLNVNATGIDVTGTAVTDGLTVAGNLSVDGGTIKLDGNYPVGAANVALGDGALDDGSLTGGYNTAIGQNSLGSNTTANNNTALGYGSLAANSTGGSNTAVGGQSLLANTTASSNTALGYNTMAVNTTGASNTAVGAFALDANTTASNNTAVGYSTLTANTTGNNNTAVGYNTMDAVTTGIQNSALGVNALGALTTGNNNVGLGVGAGIGTTTGGSNVAIGISALASNTTGGQNIAIGQDTLYYNTAEYNTAVGHNTMVANTSGTYNVALGADALRSNTTANNNTAVGYQSLCKHHRHTKHCAWLSNSSYGSGNKLHKKHCRWLSIVVHC